MGLAARPMDIEFADSHGANRGQGSLFIDGLPTSMVCTQPFVPGNDWTHLAVQGSSLSIAIDCGGQFLTRSHRTALTEQTGPVPRVITLSFLGKTPYTVLVSSSAAPEVIVMNDSFVCYGEFCQTPMVAPRGFEPHVSALKGPCPSPTRRRSHKRKQLICILMELPTTHSSRLV